MGMTDRQNIPAEIPIRTGRRHFSDFDASPRDQTVCFTVSTQERGAIDLLAACMGRTRSAMLTRIVNSFAEECSHEGQPDQLLSLLRECREAMPKESIIPPERK